MGVSTQREGEGIGRAGASPGETPGGDVHAPGCRNARHDQMRNLVVIRESYRRQRRQRPRPLQL